MKVTIEKQEPKRPTKPMNEMLPGEIGVVISSEHTQLYIGKTVMRTFSANHFEVMILSDPGKDNCWTKETSQMVEIYHDAELKVILK